MEWNISKSGELTGKLTYTIDKTDPHVRLQHTHAKTGERLDYRVRLALLAAPLHQSGRGCHRSGN